MPLGHLWLVISSSRCAFQRNCSRRIPSQRGRSHACRCAPHPVCRSSRCTDCAGTVPRCSECSGFFCSPFERISFPQQNSPISLLPVSIVCRRTRFMHQNSSRSECFADTSFFCIFHPCAASRRMKAEKRAFGRKQQETLRKCVYLIFWAEFV